MIGIKLTRGKTRRAHEWSTDNPDDIGNQVHQLTNLLDREFASGRFRTPREATDNIFTAVRGLKAITDELERSTPVCLEGTLYRARSHDSGVPPADFGPSPQRSANRFNLEGELAWYVAKTDMILVAELSQTSPGNCFWVQRFAAQEIQIKVLSLTPDMCKDFPALNQFVLLAERKVTDGQSSPHVATQLLRNLMEQFGFDAVEYPTVMGDYASDPTATNVAIFNENAIKECLDSKEGAPYRISEEYVS
ncbi:RES domain-containing protein [Desulfobacula sp.]|uniref:RES domain-containing protein n=1 Tax=Desulfobacula sp. TaxID=2593537 RepID=UPI002714C2DE|nr:RES domain-containing protein [Desulfobacula sp.]